MSDFDNYGSKVTKLKEPNSIRSNTFYKGNEFNNSMSGPVEVKDMNNLTIF